MSESRSLTVEQIAIGVREVLDALGNVVGHIDMDDRILQASMQTLQSLAACLDAHTKPAALRATEAALLSFAAEALNECWDGPDDLLQELGLKYGLLIPTLQSAPCGEACTCASVGVAFPTECYRYAPAIIAERQRIAAAQDELRNASSST